MEEEKEKKGAGDANLRRKEGGREALKYIYTLMA